MARLTKDEIISMQAARAENIRRRGKATVATIPAPSQGLLSLMATRCFSWNMNASDLKYMAMALLQMNDALAELRERVRQLEAGE
jgi:hypothetical protein